MPHHVAVQLPGGRVAMADYRQPVTHIMRRVNAWLQARHRDDKPPPDIAAAYETLGRWLDTHPEQACTHELCAPHGPASPELYTPPPYREAVTR